MALGSQLLLACVAAAAPQAATLTVASFNLQAFGPKKAADPFVLRTLASIIRRFDVVAVQEVRDRTGLALEELRREVSAGGREYGAIVGPRVGRTRSKEQVAFLYDRRKLSPLGESYTVSDPEDRLHREPLSARFASREGPFTFLLLSAHLDPDDVGRELSALATSIERVRSRFPGEDDLLVVGDLNADCAYFDPSGPHRPLGAPGYRWLIGDAADTTVKATDCAYDRIIAATGTARRAGEAGVFDFGAELGLTPAQSVRVSDHFPVWARFRVGPGPDAVPARAAPIRP